jgi:hypothetical protein
MTPVIRVLLQALLILPVFPLLIVLAMMMAWSFPLFGEGRIPHALASLFALPSALVLIASVFAPRRWYSHPKVPLLLAAGLITGIASCSVLFLTAFGKQPPRGFSDVWYFIGPISVAIWNLLRIAASRQTNQQPPPPWKN